MRPTWRSQQKREAEEEADREEAQRLEEEERERNAQHAAAESEPESEPSASDIPASPNLPGKSDGELSGSEVEAAGPALPRETRPTLAMYQEKWERLLATHAKDVDGAFAFSNLVPKPISELWQNCPYVPFDRLLSEEAQARLGFQYVSRYPGFNHPRLLVALKDSHTMPAMCSFERVVRCNWPPPWVFV